jgi:hypothetical protein
VTNQPEAPSPPEASTAAKALAAAGDAESARDRRRARRRGAFRGAAPRASQKRGLVERLVYESAAVRERVAERARSPRKARAGRARPSSPKHSPVCAAAKAFTADGKLSQTLRAAVTAEKAYGFTVPAEFGGKDGRYVELALLEGRAAANGLGALAVESPAS